MRSALIFILTCLLQLSSGAQSRPDSFSIYFRLDDPKLNTNAKGAIDSLLYSDAINDKKSILIVGYADYLGSNTYNDKLSKNRAKSVQQYLINMGIPGPNIKLCIGKGEIARIVEIKDGYAADRKVDIVISEKASKIKVQMLPALPSKPGIAKKTTFAKDTIKRSKLDTVFNQLKPGQTFVLNNIYFNAGRHSLRPESLPQLDNLVNVLDHNPTMKIRIEGHVCCVPSDKDALDEDEQDNLLNAANQPSYRQYDYELNGLSRNRALFIYYYLTSKNIKADRLQFSGFGKSKPLVYPEKTPDDENKNRRVEIRILEK